MALTIAEILGDVSLETQNYLDFASGPAAVRPLMVDWLDSTQKDLLHTGIWKHLLRYITTVTLVSTTRTYQLTPTDIRRIEAVYDETSRNFLSPIESVLAPSGLASPEDKPRSPRPHTDTAVFRSDTLQSSYYWPLTTHSGGVATTYIHVFPLPNTANVGTLTVYYAKKAPTISSDSDNANLILDQDARDALRAGILWRAFSYLDQPAKATNWKAVYELAKHGEAIQ